MDRERAREYGLNALLVLLSVGVVLSGVEVALQAGLLDVGKNQHQFCDGPIERFQFHPQYGYTEHPNSVYLEKRTAYQDWSTFVHNSEGFRDVYDTGSDNVIVLGDSFTRGTLVDQNSTYSHLLDRWNPNTAFRNYGTGGYDQTNELHVYRNVSDQVNHDLVVIGYYTNDPLTNDAESARKPTYTLEDGDLELVRMPSEPEGDSGPSLARRLYFATPLRHLQTPQFVEAKLATASRRLAAGNDEPPKPPTGAALEYKLALTRSLLEEIAAEADRHDATVLIVTIPNRGEVYPDQPHRFAVEDGRPYWEANYRMLRELESNNPTVTVLDPRPALRAEREAGNRTYGVANAHLDDRGHRVLARVIQEELVRTGFVEDGAVNYSERYESERDGCP